MTEDRERRLEEEIARLKARIERQEKDAEEMRVAHLFLGTIFEGIDEEIMIIDPSYSILDVNRHFLEQHALRKEEVIGRKCHEVTYQSESPCSFGRAQCPLERARETGQRVEVTHHHEPHAGEFRELVRIMYPLHLGGEMPLCFVEISRDVTEFRKLILKLKASEKKFRAILDTATDAILSIDSEHKVVLFNNAACRIFGYSRSEVIGRNLNMLIPPQYGDHYSFVNRFMQEKTPKIIGKTLPLTAIRKGGEEFPIELGLSFQETKGEMTFTAMIRDMTDQKQMEKKFLQSERLVAVGQTVAHVAHEIKNPLMIIGGFSHQIKKSLTDGKAVQKLDMILDEVGRLEKLVANLGDFTKEYKLMKRPADINSVIRDVLRIMEETYSDGEYVFAANLDPDIEEINCDPDKLRQVFINVIANGIEAMTNGGRISISTKEHPQGVEIQISDEGIGISEVDLDHIFEPFYTTRETGSGLGLSISYKIIEAHKGEIGASSTPDEGTTFMIRLPSG